MAGRFWSNKDVDAIDQFNKELIEDVIGQTCTIYKINAYNTKTNIYGESVGGGKNYNVGVQLPCIITASDIDWNVDLFGPDSGQNVTFAFLRNMFELTKLTTFEPLGIKLAGSEFIYNSCEKVILLISKKNIKIKFFNYSESGSR